MHNDIRYIITYNLFNKTFIPKEEYSHEMTKYEKLTVSNSIFVSICRKGVNWQVI